MDLSKLIRIAKENRELQPLVLDLAFESFVKWASSPKKDSEWKTFVEQTFPTGKISDHPAITLHYAMEDKALAKQVYDKYKQWKSKDPGRAKTLGKKSDPIKSMSGRERMSLAKSPKPLSKSELRTLAQDKNEYLRREIAERKQDLPQDVLKTLSQDKDRWVRVSIVRRKQNLPKDLLMALALDKDKVVRLALAEHRQDLPEDVLKVMGRDESWEVRRVIAKRRYGIS